MNLCRDGETGWGWRVQLVGFTGCQHIELQIVAESKRVSQIPIDHPRGVAVQWMRRLSS